MVAVSFFVIDAGYFFEGRGNSARPVRVWLAGPDDGPRRRASLAHQQEPALRYTCRFRVNRFRDTWLASSLSPAASTTSWASTNKRSRPREYPGLFVDIMRARRKMRDRMR